MSLTSKQKAFVREYQKDSNATQAAIRAGYSKHTATEQGVRLLKHPDVAAAIAEASEKLADKAVVDAEWVLKKAVELHKAAVEQNAFAAAKGALELVGKHVAVQAFRDQVQLNGLIEYKNLSDEEIAARIAAHETGRADRPTTH